MSPIPQLLQFASVLHKANTRQLFVPFSLEEWYNCDLCKHFASCSRSLQLAPLKLSIKIPMLQRKFAMLSSKENPFFFLKLRFTHIEIIKALSSRVSLHQIKPAYVNVCKLFTYVNFSVLLKFYIKVTKI